MKWNHYLYTCLAVAVLTSLVILYVPGVAGTLEARLLAFLATNAAG